MPVYQQRCQSCGQEFEVIAGLNEREQPCRCGGSSIRVPAVRGPNCFNDDAGWIKTVREVVAKDDPRPHVVEFLRNPTRANYRAWMKGEKIRPMEGNEKHEKFAFDPRKHADKVMEMKMRRERYEVRG